MNLDYNPSTCPKCGVDIREYITALAKKFEGVYAAELVRVRSKARYKGVLTAILMGVFVPTLFLSLSWKDYQQQSLVEHLYFLFSGHPYFISIFYAAFTLLFVLIYGVGKVNSRAEQRMWDQFLQEHYEYER